MEKLGLPNGKKTIEPDKLNAYIRYFGVSADYLLGFTDNMQEHINPDDMACADYMGMSHRFVKYIKHATRPDQKEVAGVADNMKKALENDNITNEYAENICKRIGFALDCFFSFDDNAYSDSVGADALLDSLYTMILEYYTHNYKSASFNDSRHIVDGKPSRSWDLNFDRSYRTAFIDIQDVLCSFVENLDYEQLKVFARDYDTRNGSSIYADLFGSDSE